MPVPVIDPSVILGKTALGLLVAGVGALLLWPFKEARKSWKELKNSINSTHAELILQRTNCLATLQEDGKEQVKLLGKMAETLDGVRLDLREQIGFLAASAPRPRTKK